MFLLLAPNRNKKSKATFCKSGKQFMNAVYIRVCRVGSKLGSYSYPMGCSGLKDHYY